MKTNFPIKMSKKHFDRIDYIHREVDCVTGKYRYFLSFNDNWRDDYERTAICFTKKEVMEIISAAIPYR